MYVILYSGKRNWDERIPHQNWLTVMGMIMVHNIAYSIPTPSIYQFITTPHSIPKELENEEVCEKVATTGTIPP